MDSTIKNGSYFCKYFNSSDREDRLRVPKSWSSKYGRKLPCSAFLRNRYGDIWVVTVARDEKTERVSFENGWNTFIANNKVEHEDRLIFLYDSKSTFDFKLFGKNDEEKEYIRRPNIVKEEEIELEEVQAVAEVCENIELHSEEHHSLQPDEEHSPDPEYQVSPIRGYFDDEDFDVDDEFADKEVSSEKKSGRKRAPRINEADEEAVFRRAGISRPENPYFVTKRRPTRNEMYIPKEIIKDFQLVLPEKIIIRDEKGMKWNADVKKWKDGRLWLSKGWKAYCKHNNVRKEDWCIIEIVKPEEPNTDIFIKTRLVPSSALKAAKRS